MYSPSTGEKKYTFFTSKNRQQCCPVFIFRYAVTMICTVQSNSPFKDLRRQQIFDLDENKNEQPLQGFVVV